MTSSRRWYILSAILIVFIFTFSSCDTQPSVGISDSLDVVADLELIEGAENSTVTVNKGTSSYFSLNVSNIAENTHVQEGTNQKGWCVLWDKPIDSNNSRHDGLALYSTFGDEKWKPVNYLLTIKPHLELQDPDLTYLEIQAAIWSLRDYPNFNVDMPVQQMPSRLVRDGQPNFDKSKVKEIVTHVNNNYESFQYNGASTYAVIAETPSDTQTIIIEVDQSVWAYGQYSFRGQAYKDAVGARGQGNSRWGWVFELDTDIATTELIAGGGSDDGTKEADEVGTIIGSLDMSKNGTNLEITYSPYNGYLVNDLHLWVGCSLDDFPTAGNSSNPSLNSFQYTYSDDPESSKSFSVALNEIGCTGKILISAHAGQLYTVEEIEVPDPDVPPVFTITDLTQIGLNEVADINDQGDIIGGNLYWDKSTNSIITMPIQGNVLNNNGEVVGFNSYWSEDDGLIEIGHLEELEFNPGPNTKRTIITKRNYAKDINDNGVVVGYDIFEMEEFICNNPDDENDCFWIPAASAKSYTWTLEDGFETTFGSNFGSAIVSGGISIAGDAEINNKGNIVIDVLDVFSLYRNNQGEITSLNSSEFLFMYPRAINDSNRIVGYSLIGSGEVEVVFLDVQNQFQPTRTGVISNNYIYGLNSAVDINNHGQIVGTINTGSNSTRVTEAFYWDEENGKIILPTLSSGGSGVEAINNHGQIIGYNTDENGNKIPVIWEITNGAGKIASN